MQAFSLEKKPFPDAAVGDYYFSTPALTARLEELCRAAESGHVVLVDEPGSGKSTMLAQFAEAMAGRCSVFRVRAGSELDARDFCHALVSSFGLPVREPVAAVLRDADTFLERLMARSRNAVIVIDDVHLLESAALGQLLYVARRWKDYRVRFLLAAEPGFTSRLDSLPENNRLTGNVVTFDMPRFDSEQVSDYLHMCLFRAGLAGDSPFSADLVSIVTQRARGLVGAVDPIARELLEDIGAGASNHASGRDGILRRWCVMVVAAAGLGILLTIAMPRVSTSHGEAESQSHSGGFQSGITPASLPSAGSNRRRSASTDRVAP